MRRNTLSLSLINVSHSIKLPGFTDMLKKGLKKVE
jgi:hypothetical protein